MTIAQDGFGGIWVNVFNPSTAATLDINDNTVNGADDVLDNTDGLGDPYPVFGIYLTTLNSNVSATLNGNTVTSYSAEEPLAAGIAVWSAPGATLSVSGGSIADAIVGIDLDNVDLNFGGSPGTTTLNVSDVAISGGTTGIRVAAVPSDYPGAPLYVNPEPNVPAGNVVLDLSGGSITGATTGINVEGQSPGTYTATANLLGGTSITSCTTGILVNDAGGTAIANVSGSTISGNTTGINVEGGTLTATNDVITGNATGVLVNGGTATLHDNDLADNSSFAVSTSGTAVDASANYWALRPERQLPRRSAVRSALAT